jgi:hypothetical protein
MSRLFVRVAALAWTLSLIGGAQASERGWDIDLSAGYVNGGGLSTELPWSLPWNRRIDAIEDGQRARLGLRWESGEAWYAFGSYTRSRFRYESPLNEGCPVTPGRFLPPQFLCQPSTIPRDGRIEDEHDQLELGLGVRLDVMAWLEGFAELSHGIARWNSDDDIEASATAQCLSFSFNTQPLPHPGCVQVNRYARAQGLNAAVGLDLWPEGRFSLSGALHHQGFRYRIYRNDLYPRFARANEIGSVDYLVANEPKGSWRWVAIQARYALTPRWSLLLNLEGGGNRDWEAVDLGVRLRL